MNTASSIDRPAAAVANRRTMRADYSPVFDALMTVAATADIKARLEPKRFEMTVKSFASLN
ncbi:MAG: hypothetical protein WBQ43_06865 [Terriglobales bacterium]